MIKLPGLIDPHVHLREPGATHKEDYDSGTCAALAGGVTMVLAMPNTKPPIFDAETLDLVLDSASKKARCDYAQFVGAGPDNAAEVARLAPRAAALKMYLDSTFGQLRLDDMTLWLEHFRLWPGETPIVTHSESRSMAAALWMAQMFDKPIHIAHISLREEVLLIKAAKEHGIKVTCEVCPHHLFLTAPSPPSLSLWERDAGVRVGSKCARAWPRRPTWMRSGRISTSSTVLPPTMPRTLSLKRMARTPCRVSPVWKRSCRCC